jgi:hypothetical protein
MRSPAHQRQFPYQGDFGRFSSQIRGAGYVLRHNLQRHGSQRLSAHPNPASALILDHEAVLRERDQFEALIDNAPRRLAEITGALPCGRASELELDA